MPAATTAPLLGGHHARERERERERERTLPSLDLSR
jgi:hypothetical protein